MILIKTKDNIVTLKSRGKYPTEIKLNSDDFNSKEDLLTAIEDFRKCKFDLSQEVLEEFISNPKSSIFNEVVSKSDVITMNKEKTTTTTYRINKKLYQITETSGKEPTIVKVYERQT